MNRCSDKIINGVKLGYFKSELVVSAMRTCAVNTLTLLMFLTKVPFEGGVGINFAGTQVRVRCVL